MVHIQEKNFNLVIKNLEREDLILLKKHLEINLEYNLWKHLEKIQNRNHQRKRKKVQQNSIKNVILDHNSIN